MKKLLIGCLIAVTVLGFCACSSNDGSQQTTGDDSQVVSSSDISDYDTLDSLPAYKGAGTIQTPWDDPEATSGFFVAGATLQDMKDYGEQLAGDGWTLNENVDDYDPEAVLYYTSKDESKLIQLKFMGEDYIRVTMGAAENVENLQ